MRKENAWDRFLVFVIGAFLFTRIAWFEMGRRCRRQFSREQEEAEPDMSPKWCLIANIRVPEGVSAKDEPEKSTNLYRFGQKIYVISPYSKGSLSRLLVVGRFRGGGRLICSYLTAAKLENCRAKLIYSPKVLAKLLKEGLHWQSEKQAQAAAEWLNHKPPQQYEFVDDAEVVEQIWPSQ